MDTEFIGDLTDTDNPVRAAGRSACFGLDLPITDAAFDLIDATARFLVDAVAEVDGAGDLDTLEDLADLAGDWYSGSGVISCYTSDQVRQWTDLGVWQTDLSEDVFVAPDASVSDRIGAELAVIAIRIASAMAGAIVQLAEEHVAQGMSL